MEPAPPPECDVLLFVATKSELEALKKAASERGLPVVEQKSLSGTFFSLGTLGGRRVVAVKTDTGGLGPKGSSANARFYVDTTRATGLILVGMAFGVDRLTQKVGDVLVSGTVFPYDDRFVEATPDGWQYEYSRREIKVYHARPELVKMVEKFLAKRENRDRARIGCLLTGSALIHARAYRDHLVERASSAAKNIIGGEMEGVGLLSLHPRGRCIWMIVKGISDFADGDEHPPPSDQEKALACENAARFVIDALFSWSLPADSKPESHDAIS